MVSMNVSGDKLGNTDVSGSLMRQNEVRKEFNENTGKTHIVHMGELLESQENRMLTTMQQIYFLKSMSIVNELVTPKGNTTAKLTGLTIDN